jgi:hypothetical protein
MVVVVGMVVDVGARGAVADAPDAGIIAIAVRV